MFSLLKTETRAPWYLGFPIRYLPTSGCLQKAPEKSQSLHKDWLDIHTKLCCETPFPNLTSWKDVWHRPAGKEKKRSLWDQRLDCGFVRRASSPGQPHPSLRELPVAASSHSPVPMSPLLKKTTQRPFPLWGRYHSVTVTRPREVATWRPYLAWPPGDPGEKLLPASWKVHVCRPFQYIIQQQSPAQHPDFILDATHLQLLALLPCEKSNRGFAGNSGRLQTPRDCLFFDYLLLWPHGTQKANQPILVSSQSHS